MCVFRGADCVRVFLVIPVLHWAVRAFVTCLSNTAIPIFESVEFPTAEGGNVVTIE